MIKLVKCCRGLVDTKRVMFHGVMVEMPATYPNVQAYIDKLRVDRDGMLDMLAKKPSRAEWLQPLLNCCDKILVSLSDAVLDELYA